VNFNDALTEATRLARSRLVDLQESIFLVRDLHGRIRLLLKKEKGRSPDSPFHAPIQALVTDITGALGSYAYPADDLLMYRHELKSLKLPDEDTAAVLDQQGDFKVCLHDRLLTGTEWNARPAAEVDNPKRFTLFSMKGGVGRSTTAAILSWHLALKGKRVLVFDLDLESPGVGATLLGHSLPRFGILDWFVEDALGQGDAFLRDLVGESKLQDGTGGRIAVVPAFGTDTGDYMAKLGRAYLERGPRGPEPWPERLKRLVRALELQETPDIVLLDSRTGLHDTSAALVLAMGAHTLMFAVNTHQTWSAYRFLFEHWARHPNVADFHDKLWMVGSQATFFDTDNYIDDLLDNAWTLFDETLYQSPEVLNSGFLPPSRDDEAGNHYPRLVFWQPGLIVFDPLNNWADQFVVGAYQSFLDWFDQVLLAEAESE
jgi:hypothetical protein